MPAIQGTELQFDYESGTITVLRTDGLAADDPEVSTEPIPSHFGLIQDTVYWMK